VGVECGGGASIDAHRAGAGRVVPVPDVSGDGGVGIERARCGFIGTIGGGADVGDRDGAIADRGRVRAVVVGWGRDRELRYADVERTGVGVVAGDADVIRRAGVEVQIQLRGR